ncbi:MAG TPA: beta-propeller fold lactonase family protein [Nocardioidaceae bacterium]|nr:beta-propeller fold lactonase family protein [Nocardioidaceae bacterium]
MTTSRGRDLIAGLAVGLACLLAATACSEGASGSSGPTEPSAAGSVSGSAGSTSPSGPAPPVPGRAGKPFVEAPFRNPLPGMPPVVDNDVYAATRAGMLSPKVAGDPAYVYVPDSKGSTVTVISQRTHKVVRVIRTGYLTQHVTPSYDLRHLYANSSAANEFVEIKPGTGKKMRTIAVPRPYNLYFTPDGKQAVVMVEQHDVIRFSDPRTFKKRDDVSRAGCKGPNHADFSGNGRFMVVTCEFSGTLLKVATQSHRVTGVLHFGGMSMPQDVRVSPDGQTFYVADMGSDMVRLVDAAGFKQVGRIRMPADPHGLYPSRDGKVMYVSDRGAGKVSVVSFKTNKIVDTWVIPGGGSPDMGGVSADGRTLWLSGRYDGEVYAFNTRTGRLVARVPVGVSPHGSAVWPQPGRYSLGHTGNMR